MITYKVKRYLPSDSMSNLICDNYPMLLVMGRFGIDLGFGEDTIEQACKRSEVDSYTFLAVVNNLVAENRSTVEIDYQRISLGSLIKYLRNSHSYFLEYRLPAIRHELTEALDMEGTISGLILSYFDEYVSEVNKHMMYEEEILFPYINSITNAEQKAEYSIEIYSKHHDKVEAKLSELKNIIIKYYPTKTTNELNTVLFDIFSCERDLAAHNSIEDFLLVPTIKSFETTQK